MKIRIGERTKRNIIQNEMKGRKERKMMRKEEGRYSGEKEGGGRSRNKGRGKMKMRIGEERRRNSMQKERRGIKERKMRRKEEGRYG
jgi:hypothetical protein